MRTKTQFVVAFKYIFSVATFLVDLLFLDNETTPASLRLPESTSVLNGFHATCAIHRLLPAEHCVRREKMHVAGENYGKR